MSENKKTKGGEKMESIVKICNDLIQMDLDNLQKHLNLICQELDSRALGQTNKNHRELRDSIMHSLEERDES